MSAHQAWTVDPQSKMQLPGVVWALVKGACPECLVVIEREASVFLYAGRRLNCYGCGNQLEGRVVERTDADQAARFENPDRALEREAQAGRGALKVVGLSFSNGFFAPSGTMGKTDPIRWVAEKGFFVGQDPEQLAKSLVKKGPRYELMLSGPSGSSSPSSSSSSAERPAACTLPGPQGRGVIVLMKL